LTAIGATVDVMVANWLKGTWVPLAERIVEDRINDRRVDAQLLGELAVDLDLHDPAGALLVAGDVRQLW